MKKKHKPARIRFMAEWEDQTMVLITWPHIRTDWKRMLHAVDKVYLNLARAISRHAVCMIVTPEPSRVKTLLTASKVKMDRIQFVKLLTDGTWIRDYGPITVLKNGKPLHLSFDFNGWGRKYGFSKDRMIGIKLAQGGVLSKSKVRRIDFILEGGSIDTDGKGALLTTEQCLLNPNRNPNLEKSDIEKVLKQSLGVKKILWLKYGHIAGDDTDSHVDTLARFAPNGRIVYTACNNKKDPHFKALRKMESELRSFRSAGGKKFKLIPLPWPDPKFDSRGNRMPANYANYLVINDAVLVPTYRDKADVPAMNAIAGAYPGKTVYGINCLPLLVCHGSLHCSTMQVRL